MSFPLAWQGFRKRAEEAIRSKKIKEIEFTGNAYQVLISDSEENNDYWVFLKFDSEDILKETICQCEEEESYHEGCWHAAAAYLAVFGPYRKSLGKRFSESLWDQLCSHLRDQLGNKPQCLVPLSNKLGWECLSRAGKRIFIFETERQEIFDVLERMIFQRARASEENSFVLSQFSNDEVLEWRAGRPNALLLYRLSFWYDLAKYLFLEHETGQLFDLSFKYSSEELPNWLKASYVSFNVGFYLSQANLPSLLTPLSKMNSPLKIIQQDLLKQLSVTYNKISGQMIVTEKKESANAAKRGIRLEGWRFVPGVGFYSEVPQEILDTPLLEGKVLSESLTEYGHLLTYYLPDMTIKHEPTPLSYEVFFDDQWNLHLNAYLHEPRDLFKGYSRIIHNWAYLDDEGFYRLEEPLFKNVETVIPKDRMPDFINHHRSWLSQFEGFYVHLRNLDYQLGYRLDDRQRLEFFKILKKNSNHSNLQEFGNWVYLKGQGFFSKLATSGGMILNPGLIVNKDQLPLFIKMNREELTLIPGFFLSKSPITHAGLELTLESQNQLKISPTYEIDPQYKTAKTQIFEDVIYVENHGFYVLPAISRLPEEYQREILLKDAALEQFIHNDWKKIQSFIKRAPTEIMLPQRIDLKVAAIEPATEKGRGWYKFTFIYETELGTFSAFELHKACKNKHRFVFTEGGRIDLSEKQFDWLQRIPKGRFDPKNNQVLLTLLEFIRLNAYDPVQWYSKGEEKHKQLFTELLRFEPQSKPLLDGLKCALRPYQEIGTQWLWFLYHQNLSGLLCDEMGLGKTHQAMALMASIRNFFSQVAEGQPSKFLIVCPTSVIHHWEDKIRQFLPGVRVCSFYGIKRDLENFQKDFDVLLTSYGVLRNEKKAISAIPFELAVFDEIQLAKNITSRIYASLKTVNAHMKLGLTGTPIENRLRELKSLFDIVLPSYMPSEKEYREYFIRPIEKENSPERKEMLNRLVHPFILRRKKSDVLTELPEKIEEIAYCDLSPYQQELYSEVLERQKKHIIEDLQNEKQPIPYLHIFALLSSLKQICDHPAVYLKKPKDYQLYASGKWDLFLELLNEARESGQKSVVFTQYLHMMDIVIAELKAQNIDFASIRGNTRDRKGQIQKFNQDPKCEVFVGSLHAAGLGVDLTAGSKVFHIDRWWNKAREDQATDRVHRIGQTRGVQVFKFVAQGTFEERIDEMIIRKGRLMEDVVGVDDQAVLKTFSREELFELLKFIEKPDKFRLSSGQ